MVARQGMSGRQEDGELEPSERNHAETAPLRGRGGDRGPKAVREERLTLGAGGDRLKFEIDRRLAGREHPGCSKGRSNIEDRGDGKPKTLLDTLPGPDSRMPSGLNSLNEAPRVLEEDPTRRRELDMVLVPVQ